jgi:GH35 family endo-1,4-beta-xylanase
LKTQKLLVSLLIAAVVVSSVAVIGAQEEEPSLRDLAEKNDLYVGAAAWTTHLLDPTHSEIMGREFSMFTPEHEAKFCMISTGRGQYNFSKFDRLVEFAEENDMVIHGHALIWHSCSPEWLESGEWTREEAIEILHEHITTVVGRYKGRIKYWDVVNEAFDNSRLRDTVWSRTIGEEYIEMAFQFAHEADPDALLLYNDYGAEQMNPKADRIYRMAEDFVARDIPIHGIGMQSHFDLGRIQFDSVAQNMARLNELGLEVQFTEIDIKYIGENDDEILRQQAQDYYHLLETCLDAENCTAFIVWGVTDKFTWLRNPDFFSNPVVSPLLFTDEYEAKPAYFALLDLLARRAGEPSPLSDEEIEAILSDDPPVTVDTTIPEPAKSDPNQLAPDSVAGVAYYAPMGVTITLDGDLSDWENIQRVTVDDGPTLGAKDTTYEFAVAADDTNLYFMANVTDPHIVAGTYGTDEWYREDSIEFYINATGDLAATAYAPGITQLGILAQNTTEPEAPLIGGNSSTDVDMSVSAVETETGYIIEASVPLVTEVWEIVPEHLGVLGFQTHLNGSSSDDRDTKLIWSAVDTQDQSFTDPSQFGQLIFWDTTQE